MADQGTPGGNYPGDETLCGDIPYDDYDESINQHWTTLPPSLEPAPQAEESKLSPLGESGQRVQSQEPSSQASSNTSQDVLLTGMGAAFEHEGNYNDAEIRELDLQIPERPPGYHSPSACFPRDDSLSADQKPSNSLPTDESQFGYHTSTKPLPSGAILARHYCLANSLPSNATQNPATFRLVESQFDYQSTSAYSTLEGSQFDDSDPSRFHSPATSVYSYQDSPQNTNSSTFLPAELSAQTKGPPAYVSGKAKGARAGNHLQSLRPSTPFSVSSGGSEVYDPLQFLNQPPRPLVGTGQAAYGLSLQYQGQQHQNPWNHLLVGDYGPHRPVQSHGQSTENQPPCTPAQVGPASYELPLRIQGQHHQGHANHLPGGTYAPCNLLHPPGQWPRSRTGRSSNGETIPKTQGTRPCPPAQTRSNGEAPTIEKSHTSAHLRQSHDQSTDSVPGQSSNGHGLPGPQASRLSLSDQTHSHKQPPTIKYSHKSTHMLLSHDWSTVLPPGPTLDRMLQLQAEMKQLQNRKLQNTISQRQGSGTSIPAQTPNLQQSSTLKHPKHHNNQPYPMACLHEQYATYSDSQQQRDTVAASSQQAITHGLSTGLRSRPRPNKHGISARQGTRPSPPTRKRRREQLSPEHQRNHKNQPGPAARLSPQSQILPKPQHHDAEPTTASQETTTTTICENCIKIGRMTCTPHRQDENCCTACHSADVVCSLGEGKESREGDDRCRQCKDNRKKKCVGGDGMTGQHCGRCMRRGKDCYFLPATPAGRQKNLK